MRDFLVMPRDIDKSAKDEERVHILREEKRKKARRKGNHPKITLFWRRFSCLFLGTMFFRHRHRVITLLEVMFPICLAIGILASFTSGISWTKAYTDRKIAEEGTGPF
jgi:hypothetical protein